MRRSVNELHKHRDTCFSVSLHSGADETLALACLEARSRIAYVLIMVKWKCIVWKKQIFKIRIHQA